jgi:FixJ family two-component response regulator
LTAAAEENATVIVIDDDESVREALRGLFESVGLLTRIYGSIQAFRSDHEPAGPCCVVLDIRLPGQGGLEFQESLAKGNVHWETVVISAHVDVAMAVRAMKAGAVDVLTKPVREQDLLEAVYRGITLNKLQRAEMIRLQEIRSQYNQLSDRERQVMALVATGLLNKQISAELGVSEATVKVHRSHVMQKMRAESVAHLVRMADTLKLLTQTSE